MTKSHEVLKKAITPCGAKSVASDMGLSQSMIYKWCQPSGDPDCSGADNPLDRLTEICRLTGDESMIDWLCQQTDSFRVKNPPAAPAQHIEQSVLKNTQAILKEFSEMLEAVTESYANGQRIDGQESVRIRKEWEELKSRAEQFVFACEQGSFDHKN
jgi:hypothetical protein